MLVLTRKNQQKIRIGDDIEIVVLDIEGGKVRLGIQAPREMNIKRAELLGSPRKDRDPNEAK